ncbi:Helix-turn-helix domain-containing protein [Jatrophihabitans endophyticus]|uniref:Helix-turn-helix domain-containing protein n=1 Tax=Jatrophihabitans endophyticus TaxID=1206085 RepID=A0A1M5RG20_9ACTN|nr:helix-turn-helix transcriptional regulator [Jatrophihabitans endophyticus]SHH25080.1 Helix-turn-helix domain-containing protein [Jatrophihabitans endophyticus]
MPPVASAAAHTLRRLRRDAGFSQEDLAHRSGVSERTIRSLESGRAKRPHRDTLGEVARALGLERAETESFVASWRQEHRRLDEYFSAAAPEEAMQRDFAAQRDTLRDLQVSTTLLVGADRLHQHLITRRTFQVVVDGVADFLWMVSFDPVTVDPELFAPSACSNMDLAASVDVLDGAKAFLGDFRRGLRAGEIYSVEYTMDYTSAHRAEVVDFETDDESLFSAVRPLSLFLEVRFDPAALPRAAWHVEQETVDRRADVVSPLPVSPFGIVQVAVPSAAPGVHGIRWAWD